MYGGHKAGLNRAKIIQSFCHRCQAVGCARSSGNDLILRRQGVVIDIVNDCLEVIACRSGNNNVLCSCIDVRHGLRFGSIESGALQNDINVQILPRKVCSILFCIDGNLLAIYNNAVLSSLYFSVITTVRCIILEKISKHLRAGKIVDCYHFISVRLKHLSESQTSNTSETIDCYSYICHR